MAGWHINVKYRVLASFQILGANYLQMADFVSGDNDSGEAASILNDGYAVDFLETLVDDTGSTDVGESCITES